MQSHSGPLWKAKYGLTGRIYWKKKFCYVDAEKFLHWQSEGRPEDVNTPPRHGFVLFRTTITEEPKIRACSFKLVDKLDNRTMMFAAENIIELEKWMRILMLPHPDPTIAARGDKSLPVIEESEDDAQSIVSLFETAIGASPVDRESSILNAVDYITSYFERNDVRDTGLRCIDKKQVEQLLTELDPDISCPAAAATFIFTTLGVTAGFISLPSFVSWWEAFEFDKQWSIYNSASKSIEKISPPSSRPMGVHLAPPTSLYTGIIDISQIRSSKPAVSSLLRLKLPTCPQVISSWPVGQETVWNDGLQRLHDSATLSLRQAVRGIKSMGSMYSIPRVPSQISIITSSTLGGDEGGPITQDLSLDGDGDSSKLSATLSYSALYGDFLEKALAGSKVIIDEFALPEAYKSATCLSLGNILCESCRGQQIDDHNQSVGDCTCDCMVYSLEGLVYRIMSHAASEIDQHALTTSNREAYVNRADKFSHKVCAADARAQLLFQSSVATIEQSLANLQEAFVNPSSDKMFLKSLLSIIKQDKVFDTLINGSKYKRSEGDLSNGLAKLRTLPSCIVDYGGFRLQVFSPLLDLNPQETLVKGLQESDSVFVDSSSHVNVALAKISKEMNIALGHIQVPRVSIDIGGIAPAPESHDERAALQNLRITDMSSHGLSIANIANTLTKDMQIHKSSDGRFYVLNINSLVPCELPTAAADSWTRLLRPELVKGFNQPLSALTFRCNDFEDDPEDSDELVHLKLMEKQTKIRLQEATAQAVENLFTSQLPACAGILDSLTFFPIDSYALGNFLHARGICCRHIGAVHDLCTSRHARELLLTHAVARACKNILGRLLRRHSRAARGVSIAAEFRKRSQEEDFRVHHVKSLKERKNLVVGFFNIVFGWSDESSLFWSATGPLNEELMENFGIRLASSRAENNINIFQVFLGLQYYSGCSFQDRPDYYLADSRVAHPFHCSDLREQDDSGFSAPTSKTYSGNIVIPGPLGKACQSSNILGESLLACGLYQDAINVFRIRLSVMNAIGQGKYCARCIKHRTAIAHISYGLGLALHLSGSENNNREAAALLTDVLTTIPKYCGISGRIITLLATIYLSLGDYEKAMLVFDSGSTVYATCFGPNHPVMASHMCSLADSYRLFVGEGGTKHARVMMSVAVELSTSAVGRSHPSTVGFRHKLAILCMESKAFEEALVLLQACMDCYADLTRINADVVECLYLQAVAYTELKNIDAAAQTCEQLFTLAMADASNSPSKPSMNSTEKIPARGTVTGSELAAMVLMGDLCIRNKDLNGAAVFLSRALRLLHESYVTQVNIGLSTAKLTIRVLSVCVAKLSRQTRTFIDTVAFETLAELPEDKIIRRIEDAIVNLREHSDWSQIFDELVEDLWNHDPDAILDRLIASTLETEKAQSETKSVSSEFGNEPVNRTAVVQLTLLLKLLKRKST